MRLACDANGAVIERGSVMRTVFHKHIPSLYAMVVWNTGTHVRLRRMEAVVDPRVREFELRAETLSDPLCGWRVCP